MSKGNIDGDVLANKLSLAMASIQSRLASTLGPAPESHATITTIPESEDVEEEVKKYSVDPEFLGLGGIRPKDFEDGSFTRRTLTSDDKFLEQLIGKKKAKAHIASRQKLGKLGTQQQPKRGREPVPKEESEDEEEGRAATFKSKRRKTSKAKPDVVSDDGEEDEQAPPVQPLNVEIKDNLAEEEATQGPLTAEELEAESQLTVKSKSKSLPSREKAKPKSYLDELLAERSKKKKNKGSSKGVS